MKKIVVIASILATTAAFAVNPAACKGCHGGGMAKQFPFSAMTKDHFMKAMKGYKAGTYGGAMKGVMANQAKKFDDAQLEQLAAGLGIK